MARPELEAELMNEFYYSRLDSNSLLSTDEKKYIEQKKTITVGYLDGFYPFSYEEDGEFKGLSRQMLEESLVDTGLKVVYKKLDNQTDGKEKLKNGTIDILCYYTDGRDDLGATGLTCLNNYAAIPLAVVIKKGTDLNEIKTISTVSALSNEIEDAFDTDSVILQICETQQDCIDSLNKNLTQGVLCSAYLTEHLLRTQIQYNDLEIGKVLQKEYPVTMLSRSTDIELKNILNKIITFIDSKVINEYLLQENVYPLITLDEFFRNNSAAISLVMTLALIIVMAVAGHIISDNRKIQDLMYKDTKMDIWNLNYLMMVGNQRRS